MQDPIANQSIAPDDNLDIKDQIFKFLVHWKWFLATTAVALLIGLIILRYSVPVFATQATIHVQDDQKGGSSFGVFCLRGTWNLFWFFGE